MADDWGSVAVVTRTFDHVDPLFFNAWTGLIAAGLRPGDRVMPATVRLAAHHAMNNIIAAFLEQGVYAHCDALLTIDHDHLFAVDVLDRLRDDPAGWEYDALGALYAARSDGRPLVQRMADGYTWDDPMFAVPDRWWDGIVEVDMLPFGFTLWRRRLFETLDPPWCHYPYSLATEDVPLSMAARRRGFRLAVHAGVEVDHMTPHVIRTAAAEMRAGDGGQTDKPDSRA